MPNRHPYATFVGVSEERYFRREFGDRLNLVSMSNIIEDGESSCIGRDRVKGHQ